MGQSTTDDGIRCCISIIARSDGFDKEEVSPMSEVVEKMDFEEFEDEGYSIKDDRGAEYALKRIKNTQDEVDKFRAYYDEQIQKMQERADGIAGFYLAHLERYFNQVPHKTTKTMESYELPSAKLVLKQQSPEFVRDDNAVLEWCHSQGNEEFIKVKESLDWAGLKKMVDVSGDKVVVGGTGEVVPGIEVVQREPKFSVTFKKEG